MNIVWDIATCCNLCCKHCGEWPYMDKASQLDRDNILAIAKNISKIASHVMLLGGEPFLVAELDEVCDIFDKNGITVDFITNGQILNPQIEEIMSKDNIHSIYVSIDGIEEDNDEVRGLGTFKNAVAFLKKLRECNYPNKFFGISAVLTKKSVRHLESFLSFFNSVHLVDAISFSVLDISGNAIHFKDELFLSDSEIIDACTCIAKMSHTLNYKIFLNTGCPNVDAYLRNACGYIQQSEGNSCDALYGSGFCSMDGFFFPCRSYRGSGIDLKRDIDWNQEYNLFSEFLKKVIVEEPPENSEGLTWCPLVGTKNSSLNILANELIINIPCPNYRLDQQIIFFESSHRYFILFCKHNEYTEYTVEGFEIYKSLYAGLSTNKIAAKVGLPLHIVKRFLDSEAIKEHIVIIPGG